VPAHRTSALLVLFPLLVGCGGGDAPGQDAPALPPAAGEPTGAGPTPGTPSTEIPSVPGEEPAPAEIPGGAEPGVPGGPTVPGPAPSPSTPAGDPGPETPGQTPSQDATAILTRAAARLAELRGFCGDFRQEIQVPLLGQTTRSAGRLCQQRPNLFAMDFTDPQGDRVVADGTWVWTYFPSTDPRQVVRFPLAEQGRMDFFQEFVADPGVRYTPTLRGEEVVGGRPAWRIALAPRDRTHFSGATVWIDRETSLMRKVEIQQDNGSVRIVELGELELNPTIPAARFTFTPPEGVQVYTPPTGGGA
jgi:outer membrane lipoprotein carrier protein